MRIIRINPSHQKDNRCILGGSEADHCKIIAGELKKVLDKDSLVYAYLIGDAPALKNDKERLKWSISQSNKIKADLHVAIHTNAGGGDGTECIYYSDDKKYATGKTAALCINKELTELFFGRKCYANKNLAELNGTNCPAVIIEAGFHDTIKNARTIHSQYKRIAQLIAEGIYETFDIKKRYFYVQVGAFTNRENAEDLVKQLKQKGFEGIIKSS